MKLKAYAKINLILNVLGTRPDGYHEVSMLMQAISLADEVTVTFSEPGTVADPCTATPGTAADPCTATPGNTALRAAANSTELTALRAADFEYGESDLAWKAALLMTQTFRPNLLTEQSAILCVGISIDKHIPAAAGLAGGSSDAAAVLVGLGKLWHVADTQSAPSPDSADDRLLQLLLPLGAKLGSDVPFCIAAQLGHPAAIATGTGTDLEFVRPIDSGVALYFSERTIPNKTRAVYAELQPGDCRHIYDIRAFLDAAAQNDASQPAAADRSQGRLSAEDLAQLRPLLGNHLQAPAERLMERLGIARPSVCCASTPADGTDTAAQICNCNPVASNAVFQTQPLLCGAGPTYFELCPDGPYRTVLA